MPTEYGVLRGKMLSLVQSEGQFSLPALILAFNRDGIVLDEDDLMTVEQIIHEFYFEGIIVPGVKPRTNVSMQSGTLIFPHYHRTKYGDMVMRNTEYQPHDPDGYLTRIRTEILDIDNVIIRYLEESLSCYRKNLLLAAAVMLGCAAEKAILLLIDTFGNTLSCNNRAEFERETNTFIISRKYRALWMRLEPMARELPNNLGDNLRNVIDGIFDIIRTTRNEAGHPSGNIIEKEAVHANLLLFPIFCKRIYGLIQHFMPESSPPRTAGQ
jgi:hypothetical protein